jgi:hypothetical protein
VPATAPPSPISLRWAAGVLPLLVMHPAIGWRSPIVIARLPSQAATVVAVHAVMQA